MTDNFIIEDFIRSCTPHLYKVEVPQTTYDEIVNIRKELDNPNAEKEEIKISENLTNETKAVMTYVKKLNRFNDKKIALNMVIDNLRKIMDNKYYMSNVNGSSFKNTYNY